MKFSRAERQKIIDDQIEEMKPMFVEACSIIDDFTAKEDPKSLYFGLCLEGLAETPLLWDTIKMDGRVRLLVEIFSEYIVDLSKKDADREAAAKKINKFYERSAHGGKIASEHRKGIRTQLQNLVKKEVEINRCWNDLGNTTKSISNKIYDDMIDSLKHNGSWKGLSHKDIKRAKIGKQTIADAVSKTDPR